MLFSGFSGPADSRTSTLRDIAQGLGLSGVEGSEGPGTGKTNDTSSCVYIYMYGCVHSVCKPFELKITNVKQMLRVYVVQWNQAC